ncbi:hypothetical protein J8M20_01185 [Pseudoalteromonas luteoviolacea]|uniref:hypothetical protein n=1 Tax=Pseudoalteromonas luteoviolacea TaxID=43657 RepID=UPI001B399D80|nr:hypothetical protein [Pseudoalteromonas luteoviolacea]MBQ4809921.1 hypothetical protein [Pseudoalteromonas luteoviolacea]
MKDIPNEIKTSANPLETKTQLVDSEAKIQQDLKLDLLWSMLDEEDAQAPTEKSTAKITKKS